MDTKNITSEIWKKATNSTVAFTTELTHVVLSWFTSDVNVGVNVNERPDVNMQSGAVSSDRRHLSCRTESVININISVLTVCYLLFQGRPGPVLVLRLLSSRPVTWSRGPALRSRTPLWTRPGSVQLTQPSQHTSRSFLCSYCRSTVTRSRGSCRGTRSPLSPGSRRWSLTFRRRWWWKLHLFPLSPPWVLRRPQPLKSML